MAKHPLTDKDRLRLNASLKELEDLQEQIELAKQAGIPGADDIQKRCEYCRDNIVKIKATYFPRKP